MVGEGDVVWASALPAGTSAQRAELIALTQALTMGKDKKLNIYTESRYVFATAHVHGAIYQETGLLTTKGNSTQKSGRDPIPPTGPMATKETDYHTLPSHQKGDDPVAKGNQLADQVAREVAMQIPHILPVVLPDPGDPELPNSPKYSPEDINWAKSLPMSQFHEDGWYTGNGKLILPKELGDKMLSKIYRTTHMGIQRMQDLLRMSNLKIQNADTKIEKLVSQCKACQMTNATRNPKVPGNRP